LRHAELTQEIASLRAALAAMSRPPAAARNGEATGPASALERIADAASATAPDTTRIGHELEEVVNSTEQATQKVLAAAEEIDQLAQNLAAALQGRFEQGLARDIQDLVIRIFEACNFQDLAGQRIAKVLATLNAVEAHARRSSAQPLHGPRLETDAGHVAQPDIDAMFSGNN
jgi:chemotaxis protein CheZ